MSGQETDTNESSAAIEAEFDAALESARVAVIEDKLPALTDADEPAPAATPEPVADKEPAKRHPGAKHIDLATATPDEIQNRLNFLTSKTKSAEEDNELIRREYREMRDALNMVMANQHQSAAKQHRQEINQAMATLRAQLREARDNGDDEAAERFEDLLLDLKMEQKLAGKTPPATPAPIAPPPPPSYEAEFIERRMSQKDEKGEETYGYLRDTHPLNDRAALETAALRKEWMGQRRDWSRDLTTFMDELHTRMQAHLPKPATPSSAPVLSGKGANLANGNSGGRIKLTSQERYVAMKMGLSDEEYFQSKQQIEKARKGTW